MEAVNFYEGSFYALSNFSAHQVEYQGVLYPTSEHAYQAAKFSDAVGRKKITHAPSAFLAREFGQSLGGRTENFDKVTVMKEIMRAKLQQHDDVRAALGATGGAQILKNHPDDFFWGTGMNGTGENMMGKIWMELREELKDQIIFQQLPADFNSKFTCAAVFVELENKILLLERQDNKSEPGRWGRPAGKVEIGEEKNAAARRELFEETGMAIDPADLKFVSTVYVRYPNVDFTFTMFSLKILQQPNIIIKFDEHKNFAWVTIAEALAMDLVTGERECIQSYYSL